MKKNWLKKIMLVGFFVVVIVPISLFFYFILVQAEREMRQDIGDKLRLLADAKEGQVYVFLETLKIKTAGFASDYFIEESIRNVSANSALLKGRKETEAAVKDLNNYLTRKKDADKTLLGILVTDADGVVVASTDKNEIGRDEEDDVYFQEGKKGNYVSKLMAEEQHFRFTHDNFLASSPIKNETGEVLGVVISVFDVQNLEDILSGKFQKEQGAETGGYTIGSANIYMVNKNYIMFVHPSGAEYQAKEHRQEMKSDILPARECFERGREFSGSYKNYFGKDSIGASMCFPSQHWTLIAEMNADEALAPVIRIKNILVLVSSAFFILIIVAAYFGISYIAKRQRKLDETKSAFISIAAHQLMSPLGAMRWGFESIIKKLASLSGGDGKVLSEARDMLQKIYEKDLHFIDLVKDLLRITRMEEGRKEFSFTKESTRKLIEAAIAEIMPIAEGRKLSVEFVPGEDIEMMVDKNVFQEVATNLISNSIRYNKDGGNIKIELKRRGKEMEFTVFDTGIGIPEKEQDKLFTPFFRTTNAMLSSVEGVGVGLYMIKLYIEKWGGKIWFESEEGKWTKFHVVLPVK